MLEVALLALVLACQDAPAKARFVLDEAAVARAAEATMPWVSEDQGVELGKLVRVRIATSDDVKEALVADNLPVLEARLGSADLARTQAEEFASGLAPGILAKYAFSRREILVSPEGFDLNATMLEIPELLSEDVLRAVLVHEFVHAADDARFNLSDTLVALVSAEKVDTYNAVIEGHAQLVARRICEAHGIARGFETFCRAIAGEPSPKEGDEDSNAVLDMLARLMRLQVSGWYVQGERFMQEIEREGGADAIRRAFVEPPARMALVYQPNWYLHPELEPKGSIDLEAALDDIATDWTEADWTRTQKSATVAEIEAAMSLATPDERARIAGGVRANRILVLVRGGGIDQAMVAVMLAEFSSEEAATDYVTIAGNVSKKKDEAMKTGPIRIVASESAEPPASARKGLYVHKKLRIDPLDREFAVANAVVAEGTLAVELVYSNFPGSTEDLATLVNRAFVAASTHRLPETAAPANPPKSGQ